MSAAGASAAESASAMSGSATPATQSAEVTGTATAAISTGAEAGGSAAAQSGGAVAGISAAGAGGMGAPDMQAVAAGAPAIGPCPAGWMCVDPVASSPIPGLIFKDATGAQVPYTCTDGSMMVVDCDDANPKASCSALDNPICAHIDVAGESLTACAQRCLPST